MCVPFFRPKFNCWDLSAVVPSFRCLFESDRYLKIPEEVRICDICREGIGDEYHHFLHCNHVLLELSRYNFENKIRNISESPMLLNSHSLVVYFTMMSD